MAASQLIKDLSNVPNIIGALGLSIAAAQKALDANYLDGIERLMTIAKMLLDPQKAAGALTDEEKAKAKDFAAIVQEMLLAFAPSRYQYTETTLDVKLDLAQSLDFSGAVGLGMGFGAVSVNAAFSVGYSSDYRAAAECRTVIHAISPNATVFNSLLDRAGKLDAKSLELPGRSEVDQKFIDQTATVFEKMTGIEVKKPA